MNKSLRLNILLLDAAEKGDLPRVKELIAEGADPHHKRIVASENAFDLAVRNRRAELVTWFLAQKKDLGITQDELQSMLEQAILRIPGEKPGAFLIPGILAAGADVAKTASSSLHTPAGLAVSVGDVETLETLFNHGVDASQNDVGEEPLLCLAMLLKKPSLIRCLVLHGADPEAKRPNGQNAYTLAKETGCETLLAAAIEGHRKEQLERVTNAFDKGTSGATPVPAKLKLKNG